LKPPLQDWIRRIYTILGISNLDEVPAPWFLVPAEDQRELTDNDAQLLFAALRGRLFEGQLYSTVGCIKNNLYSLEDAERVVLLYALRYIALRGAGQNRYWPVCLKMLFDERIPLGSLQMYLAPVLTDQWLHIYKITKNRLFRPKFGKRNIKWPLAHAGLLVRDRQLLDQFFADMTARYSSEEFQVLLTEDYIDDFILELDDWLRKAGHLSEPFSQALLDSERGPIVAELAQQYLTTRDHAQPQSVYRSDQGEFARREILYDSSENQLQIRMTLQLPYNQGSLFVKWEDGDYPFFTDTTGTRFSVILPLRRPSWPENIPISGSFSRSLRMPTPSTEPIVFEGRSGRRVRRWQPGGSYHVLLPPKYQSVSYHKYLSTVFAAQQDCGPIRGEWSGFTMLWVQLAKIKLDEHDVSGRTADELNEAADQLDLPTFEAFWQPQATLVGGQLLNAGEIPSYDITAPPFVQVQGVWDLPLDVTFQYWDRERKRFASLATLTIPDQQVVRHHVLMIDSTQLSLNQIYRVCIDGEPTCQWQAVAEPQVIQSKRLLAAIHVEYGDDSIDNPSRFQLVNGSLVVRAWPHAELELFATDGNHQHQQTIWLDSNGEARIRWADTALSNLEGGDIRVKVLWRRLPVSRVLRCQSTTTLLPEDIEVSFCIAKPDTVEIIAALRDLKQSMRILVLVLGAQPWNGQIWQSSVTVDTDSLLMASVDTSRELARWIIVCQHQTGKRPEVLVAKRIPGAPLTHVSTAYRQSGKTPRQWKECAAFLASGLLPIDLQRLVQWQYIQEILDRPNVQHLQKVNWRKITTGSEVGHLRNWLRLGVQVPYALCEWTPSEGVFNPRATVLIPADLAVLQQALQQPAASVAVRVRRSDGAQYEWPEGKLLTANDEGEYEFRIHSQGRIRACPECRTVLPAMWFSAHKSISIFNHTCSQNHQLVAVESAKVYLVALFDSRELLRLFARHILSLLNGHQNDLPDIVQGWLEAVYPFYEQSGGVDERSWLLGLCQAINVFLDILNNDDVTSFASRDMRNVVQYKDTIDALLLRIQEW